jgi:predicted RNase H-like HicB family nuclease
MTGSNKQPKYTVIIQWSPEDNCYVVSFPEWEHQAIAHTHGDTYEEAAKNAREVLELLMEDEFGKPVKLPAEKHFHYPGADVVNLPDRDSEQSPEEAGGSRSRRSA